jgi:hypothetical protein
MRVIHERTLALLLIAILGIDIAATSTTIRLLISDFCLQQKQILLIDGAEELIKDARNWVLELILRKMHVRLSNL